MLSGAANVRSLLDEQPTSRAQTVIFACCAAVALLEGFDTAVVGFAAPTVAREMSLQPSQMGLLLSVGFLGLLVTFISGPLADRFGRKPVVICGTILFGLAGCTCALSSSIAMLTIARFFTGVGIGGAMPAALALLADHSAARNRSFAIT